MNNSLDYFQLLAEDKGVKRIEALARLKLAILADCAVQHFIPICRALFRRCAIAVEIYEGAFDAIELEVHNPSSALYEFEPDVIVILNSVQSLRDKFYQRNTGTGGFRDQVQHRMLGIWDSIRQRSSAVTIQSTFPRPSERFFGNYELKVEDSFQSVVATLNQWIVEEARKRSHLLLNDVGRLAAWVGEKNWSDERFWALAKSYCALDYIPLVAHNIIDVVMATRGRGVKCVVLDLDNTLWGGVVGDDGPLGIQIAAHGDGEPFYRFQCYLRELRRRGILLAVCSKNEYANAVGPFEQNSEMVLRLTDFAVFVANWENKADNIKVIRDALNIGLDSMVFVDDNPFERNLIRTLMPEVLVPEIPEDPADYVAALSELNLFETISFTAEDARRSELYAQEAQRRIAESNSSSFQEYMESLDMCIEVGRFTSPLITRISQLIQRSNQFNLTTHRYSPAQCEEMMHDAENYIPLYASLRDRFGDHGLISVVVLRPKLDTGALEILDWLMSCRVLSRGVEDYMMSHVMNKARRLGLPRVTGQYIPTLKNAMVKDFFGRFGFQQVSKQENGVTDWEIEVSGYEGRHVHIRAEKPDQISQGNLLQEESR